jgi:hypothetical protein
VGGAGWLLLGCWVLGGCSVQFSCSVDLEVVQLVLNHYHNRDSRNMFARTTFRGLQAVGVGLKQAQGVRPAQQLFTNQVACFSANKDFFSPHIPKPGDESATHKPVKVAFGADPRIPESSTQMPDDIDEFLANIDTTLTPEQRAKVDRIKSKMKGPLAKRSFYRDVPTPDELDAMKEQSVPVKLAQNAEALIDFALSFVNEKTGGKRSRHKKRMQHRWQQTINDHARRKAQTKASNLRKLEKQRKSRELCKKYKIEAGIEIKSGYKSQLNA